MPVLASSNAGKLAELRDLLGDGFELHAQSGLGVEGCRGNRPHLRRERDPEGAACRARHRPARARRRFGLCVDALRGAPGLYSARYSGVHGDSEANIDKLLRELDGTGDAQRGARFVCVLALLRDADDPQPIIAEGLWEGRILHERRATTASATTRCSSTPRTASRPRNSIRRSRTRSAIAARRWRSCGNASPRCADRVVDAAALAVRAPALVRAQMPVLRFQLARAARRTAVRRLRRCAGRRPRPRPAAGLGPQRAQRVLRRRHAPLFPPESIDRFPAAGQRAPCASRRTRRSRWKPTRARSSTDRSPAIGRPA